MTPTPAPERPNPTKSRSLYQLRSMRLNGSSPSRPREEMNDALQIKQSFVYQKARDDSLRELAHMRYR